MASRKRNKKSTVERGYGRQHQLARKIAIARLVDGQPCAQCWYDRQIIHPMYKMFAAKLDLSHTADRTGYTGLSWAACNRREAAQRGNAARGRQQQRKSSVW